MRKYQTDMNFCYLIVGERDADADEGSVITTIMDRWMKIDHSIYLYYYYTYFFSIFNSLVHPDDTLIDRSISLVFIFPYGSISHLLSFSYLSRGKSDLERLHTHTHTHTHTPIIPLLLVSYPSKVSYMHRLPSRQSHIPCTPHP